MSADAASEFPPGPLPPKEELTKHMRGIFQEVGPQSLTMKILRVRLAGIYKQDFKDHTPTLQTMVQELIQEPAITSLMQEGHAAAKAAKKPIGGARKVSKDKKRSRSEKDRDDKKAGKHETKMKRVRAEGEPAKGQSAYFIFADTVRDEQMQKVRDANDGKGDVAKVGKAVGELWAALGEEGQKKYRDLAEADKERYQKEYKAWEEGGGKPAYVAAKVKRGSKKDKKKDKDPNKPKKAMSAYFLFSIAMGPEVREKWKQDHDGKVDIAGTSKKIKELWDALDDEGRAKWKGKEVEDQARYKRECEERGYVGGKKVAADAAADSSSSSSDSDSDSSSDSD